MWQEELKSALRSPQDLFQEGLISEEEVLKLEPVLTKYQFLLPKYYASLIDKKNPHCPIRLQAIPSVLEEDETEGFVADPLGDLNHQPKPRLTHRFKGRVLVHLTPNCSMYCRFCFRKTLLNELKPDLFAGSLDEAMEYVEAHHDVEEVIFSGGDPFMTNDSVIAGAMERLKNIPTVLRVRFHTRVPVTFPMRVTDFLVHAINRVEKPVVVVTHFNHPKEMTDEATRAIDVMKNGRFTILNQSVLLRGVNDSFETLALLSRRLFAAGILPYYLHQLDRTQGTSYFEVSPEVGRDIYQKLRSSLSGYLVPRYVQDVVGAPFKSDL